MIAEKTGYVIGLSAHQGQLIRAGAILCYLADKKEEAIPKTSQATFESSSNEKDRLPQDLRITEPALKLARREKLDLSQLPRDQLITESKLRSLLSSQAVLDPKELKEIDPDAILVYGGGGHGKSVIDLLRTLGCYHIVAVLDDGLTPGSTVLGVPVLGGAGKLPHLFAQGVHQAVNAVGGIGNLPVRKKVFQDLKNAGFNFPTIVHPTAFVESSAELSNGIQVFPQAYIGSDVHCGFGAIINSGAIVSHDCVLGDYVNLSPGAILAGEVNVGSNVLIGMGATVNLRVNIGVGARIGNGATIKEDVPPNAIIRAGSIWPA